MHENIVSTKTTNVIKILWIVHSPICNMYVMTPLWKPFLHTVMAEENLFDLARQFLLLDLICF